MSTEATVIVGGCPAPTPNGMIEVSRLNALVEEGLVEPTYLLQGPVYAISEKGKALFNEIYNSFHREAQKTFLNKIALKYKGI